MVYKPQISYFFIKPTREEKWKDQETTEEAADSIEDLEEISDLERCIKPNVLNVARNAKFLSSQLKDNRFTAENAMLKRIQDDSNKP